MTIKPRLVFLYGLTFVLAVCSLLYELLIAQTISFLAANTAARYSFTIGCYVGGMGIGALLCRRFFGKKQAWEALFAVELVLSALGGTVVLGIYFAHIMLGFSGLAGHAASGLALFFFVSFGAAVAVGLFTGFELPLLIRMANEEGTGNITNRVLGVDYFGSLAAAVAFPAFLLPRFELLEIGFVSALANAGMALCIIAVYVGTRGSLKKIASAGLMIALLAAGLALSGGLQQYFLKRYYYYFEYISRLPRFDLFSFVFNSLDFPRVERVSSAYQKIDVVRLVSYGDPFTPNLINTYSSKYVNDPQFPRRFALFLNGDYQVWSDFEEVYHEYFAHVPIISRGRVPQNILVLGAGDGLLTRELVKYPQVKSITVVELDAKMIELARSHPVFKYMNKGAFEDPRVRVVIADAYHYVQHSAQAFDAVYVDFPDPKDYNLAKLYSREFYHFVGKLLAPGGYMVIDAPGIEDSPGRWEIYSATLKSAGFNGVLPYGSNLETDNEGAREVARGMLGHVTGMEVRSNEGLFQRSARSVDTREEMVEKVIQIYVDDLRTGFIIASADEVSAPFVYKDPGVPLCVLNGKRFDLAFAFSFPSFTRIDPRKVNSITRPTLPDTPFWWVRMPY